MKSLSIRNKLLILVTTALLLIAFFSLRSLVKAYNEWKLGEELERGVKFSIHISNLVHELQKERGVTAGYLGSGGKKFVTKLPNQRKETDKRIVELQNFLKSEDFRQIKSQKIIDSFRQAYDMLKNIQTIRQRVDSLQIPLKEAIGYYTKTNGKFLNTVAAIATRAPSIKLTRELSAYTNFLLSKERAGIERAVMSATFAADRFLPGMFVKYITLLSEQNAYFISFELIATSEMVERFKNILNDPVVAEVKRMEDIAITKAKEGGFGVDPQYWFNTITKKINLLKKIEEEFDKILLRDVHQALVEDEEEFYIDLVLVFVGILLIIFLGYTIAEKSISKPIATLSDFLERVVRNNDFSQKIKLETKDEIGAIATSINKLLETMRELLTKSKMVSSENASIASELSVTATEIGKRVEEEASIVSDTTQKADRTKRPLDESMRKLQENVQNIEDAGNKLEVAKKTILDFVQTVSKGSQNEKRVVGELEKLIQQTDETKEVLELIESIANQTNLLALNAAIEAARAGESGKGFAVVAEEVRNLAEKSSKHVETINETINNLLRTIESIGSMISSNAKEFEQLAQAVEQVEHNVEDVSSAMDQTIDESRQTMQAIENVATNIEELIKDIEKINKISSSNAKSVEEIAVATDHLYKQIEELNQLLEKIKT